MALVLGSSLMLHGAASAQMPTLPVGPKPAETTPAKDPAQTPVPAPTKDSPEPPERQLRVFTWGLVPSWAKDPSIGNRMINARMETVAEKPAYKKAFAVRRCLLPADGYFEWYPTEQRTAAGKPRKQPFFIRPKGGGVLAMAGLYEIWRDPAKDDDDPDRFRWTCTVITREATDTLGHIHDRCPVLVPADFRDAWLDCSTGDAGVARRLLDELPEPVLEPRQVSTTVNSVRNDGPELVLPAPVSAEPVQQQLSLDIPTPSS